MFAPGYIFLLEKLDFTGFVSRGGGGGGRVVAVYCECLRFDWEKNGKDLAVQEVKYTVLVVQEANGTVLSRSRYQKQM